MIRLHVRTILVALGIFCLAAQAHAQSVSDQSTIISTLTQGAAASLDLEIPYLADKNMLSHDARPQLQELGKALSESALKGKKLEILGGDGTIAEAVKNYLVRVYRLDETLITTAPLKDSDKVRIKLTPSGA